MLNRTLGKNEANRNQILLTMKTDLNILIDNVELNCEVIYSRCRESSSDEAEIIIESISYYPFNTPINIIKLYSDSYMKEIKERCERHYQNEQLNWMMERDEERWANENQEL